MGVGGPGLSMSCPNRGCWVFSIGMVGDHPGLSGIETYFSIGLLIGWFDLIERFLSQECVLN